MKRCGASLEVTESKSSSKKTKLSENCKEENKNVGGKSGDDIDRVWRVEEELQYEFSVNLNTSRNIVRLLDEGNSIPFIARYIYLKIQKS